MIKRMKQLIYQLNKCRDEYYNESNPSISDVEYDRLYDELAQLEKKTGIYMSNSPTQSVGYEVKSKLDKIKHTHLMLSLDKTKSTEDLITFAGEQDCILSLKMDGLTVLLAYEEGTLVQAETRGNGEEGEVITHNAKVFENIPLHIDYKGHLEVEGEAIITYKDFEEINSKLSEEDKYKNPRNLASGSVRQLDSNITKDRHVKFIVWKVPYGVASYSTGFEAATKWGFEVVPYVKYNKADKIEEKIEELKAIAEEKSYPIDGLVITYDNVEYGKSLGMTGHHPKHSLAFKFYDEEVSTRLKEVEWTMGKTGVLTPVAIFEPVELEGTSVERASLHNLSVMQELGISHKGQIVNVYKANQIIPQIKSAESDNQRITDNNRIVPAETCPICGADTMIVKENDTKVLICTNPDCKGKLLGKLTHFCSKNAINIEGLSEQTLQKFIELGWTKSFQDIMNLKDYGNEMVYLEGFGEKSVDKLIDVIEKSKNTTLDRFLYSLSIPLIGRSASKDISRLCYGDEKVFLSMVRSNELYRLVDNIEGFGEVMYKSLCNYCKLHLNEIEDLLTYFVIEKENAVIDRKLDLSGTTFVITGSLEYYKNRDELVSIIEKLGGKVSNSVSTKTFALICNENSGSTKSKKAASLGVPVWTEKQLMEFIK